MGDCQRYYMDAVTPLIWLQVYEGLRDSGRLEHALPHLDNPGFDVFYNIVAGSDRNSWLITVKDEIGGVVYLSDLEGTRAYIHFAFLPAKTMRTRCKTPVQVAMGRFAVASLLRDKKDGKYILDTLIGITPATNTAAVKMVRRCGAVDVGEIPHACPIAGKENVSGLVTYFTRETTSREWLAI